MASESRQVNEAILGFVPRAGAEVYNDRLRDLLESAGPPAARADVDSGCLGIVL